MRSNFFVAQRCGLVDIWLTKQNFFKSGIYISQKFYLSIFRQFVLMASTQVPELIRFLNCICPVFPLLLYFQVYNDSEEGKRFMQFYKLNQWPYVAVIDPFTGSKSRNATHPWTHGLSILVEMAVVAVIHYNVPCIVLLYTCLCRKFII